MSSWIQDVRYALRSFAKSPGFTAAAIATLAIGIGANAAIFGLVQAVILRPLPFDQPDRVVYVSETWQGRRGSVSAGNFEDLRRAVRSFEALAAVRYGSFNLAEAGEPERVEGARVTESFFRVFGVRPLHGRVFGADEDKPGGAPVVVLSHRLWRSRFGGAPDTVGRTIRVDGAPRTIVGIMPASFDFYQDEEQLWVPAGLTPEDVADHDRHNRVVYGRLAPGVSIAAADREADAIGADLRARYPKDNSERGLRVQGFRDLLTEDYRGRLLILMAAVGVVLLIACTNVSNMLLARGASRARELTVRAALGASRARLARQLLTESLVLGVAGGALGIALAAFSVQALVAASPAGVPRIEQAGVDGGVLAFALALSVGASLLFGLLPAARVARGDLQGALREGGRGVRRGGSRDRLRAALVAAQVALAVTLLVGAGLLIRTALHLQRVAPGFDMDVVTASLTLPPSADAASTVRTIERLDEELGRMPNVAGAAITTQAPLGQGGNSNGILAEEWGLDMKRVVDARLRIVTNGYFSTLRVPILRGRGFEPTDRSGAPRVIVLSRALAERIWPGQEAIGKRILCCDGSPEDPRPKTVIGVAGDVRSRGPSQEIYPEFYLPVAQAPDVAWDWVQRTVSVVARASNGRVESLGPSLREALRRTAPEVPLYDVQTMRERLRSTVADERFVTILLTALGAVGLLLAAIGIYGVIAYFVAQRTSEFGVRIALGATPRDILLVSARHGLLPIGIGLGAGAAAALSATGLMSAALHGVSPRDPLTFVAVIVVLAATAAVAAWVPARRATRIDPSEALRAE
ncbi:MAG TPA: ABC transporter permease [Thermoanaerobaculia bacterium]|jgi:predicted permease|nr:ABC transporter permease [Thermoanaerobaculia bacterium]